MLDAEAEAEIHRDISLGLDEQINREDTIIFSVGYRCTSASLIKHLNLKFASYPFDWVVSKLDVITDCLETKFKHYLKPENYRHMIGETCNQVNSEKIHFGFENIVYNEYYESTYRNKKGAPPNNFGTYGMNLSLTHHDMRNEEGKGYFTRCIKRFQDLLQLPQRKFYLYTHPLQGNNDFETNNALVLSKFIEFHDNFTKYSSNLFGIFFMVVRNENRKYQIEEILKTEEYNVFVIYTNNQLIDIGGVYDGDFFEEQNRILLKIEEVIKHN
jgi:hypothetical protein